MSTIASYTGDGSNREFDITFTYRLPASVQVKVDGAEVSFSFLTSSRVQLDVAPGAGSEVLVYRATAVGAPEKTFSDGAIMHGADLNTGLAQVREKAEELESSVDDAFGRVFRAPAGETVTALPAAEDRANKYAAFDEDGNLSVSAGSAPPDALALPSGASLVGFQGRTAGALARDLKGRLAERVSAFDYIPSTLHASILLGTCTTDLTAYLQAALDTGETIYCPGNATAKYPITCIKLTTSYQALIGEGARLYLQGADPTKNGIELLSTRRDTGDLAQTRTRQQVSGFRITGPTTASYASLIFVEEGTFFPFVANLISEAGTNKGYFGSIADAFIRVNGDAVSYVNDVTIRDVEIHAISTAPGTFPPCGIWIEGCIEGRVENTKAFYYRECMRLGDNAGVSRNVQHMIFDQVQLEPTKPSDVVDGLSALKVYRASACMFRNCRLDPGNGVGSTNSAAVRVSAGGDGAKQLRFNDCSFQGFGNVNYVFVVEAGATAVDITVSGDVRDFLLGRVSNAGAADIRFADDCAYTRIVPKRTRLRSRGFAFEGLTVGSGAGGQKVSLTDVYLPEGTPCVANLSVDQVFCTAEPYRVAARGTWKVQFYQLTGSTRSPAASQLNLRPFRDDEILAQSAFANVNYASINSGSAASSSYFVPGARKGMPILASFYDGSANGLNGVLLEAWATADNTVTVLRANSGNAAVDLASGTLVISVLKSRFDLVGALNYNLSAVTAGTRQGTSVSVPGAELGDNVVAWYSGDQEGVIVRGYVSEAGTVRFELLNFTGTTPTGDVAGQLYAGLLKNPTSI